MTTNVVVSVLIGSAVAVFMWSEIGLPLYRRWKNRRFK